MRVLVTGGRNFTDREFVFATMDRIEKESGKTFRGLIHGCANGLDEIARQWQSERIKKLEEYFKTLRAFDPKRSLRTPRNNELWIHGFPAQWDDLETPPVVLRYRADGTPYNAAAGGIRNQKMVDYGAELGVSFPGGRGTYDCTSRMRKAGIPVIEVAYG